MVQMLFADEVSSKSGMKKGIVVVEDKENRMPDEAIPRLRANFQIREEKKVQWVEMTS